MKETQWQTPLHLLPYPRAGGWGSGHWAPVSGDSKLSPFPRTLFYYQRGDDAGGMTSFLTRLNALFSEELLLSVNGWEPGNGSDADAPTWAGGGGCRVMLPGVRTGLCLQEESVFIACRRPLGQSVLTRRQVLPPMRRMQPLPGRRGQRRSPGTPCRRARHPCHEAHEAHATRNQQETRPAHAQPTEWGSACVEEQSTWASPHGNAARQVVDGLRTEVWGQQKQSNDPRNNQHNPNYWAPNYPCQLLGAAGAQTAHPATFGTAPAHPPLGSANAETTPAGTPAAAADRTQRPDATREGKTR